MGLSLNVSLPAGSVQQFAGAAAPSGWLECGGQAVSRTTYAALFLAIGTAFGAGDGSTTFNVPDMRGRVGVGRDNMGGTAANRVTSGNSGLDGVTLGAAGGGEVVTLSGSQMPVHDHIERFNPNGTTTIVDGQILITSGVAGNNVKGSPDVSTATTPVSSVVSKLKTSGAGGGAAHANVQPSLIINWIIKT